MRASRNVKGISGIYKKRKPELSAHISEKGLKPVRKPLDGVQHSKKLKLSVS
jgi:hypothetical protein